MRATEFSRFALGSGVAAALLSACSAVRQAQDDTIPSADAPGAVKNSETFNYTGAEQTFNVPAGVAQLTVVARGGEGIGGFYHGYGTPGFPGRVYAVVRVHPGDRLYVFVAGSGRDGGFNGGGAGGSASGGFGGGASDVRMGGDRLKDRIIVAAGGGSAGSCTFYCYADGGDGGGLTGRPGFGYGGIAGGGGGGGTQRTGGKGGAAGIGDKSSQSGQPGGKGALGQGGSGGAGGQAGSHPGPDGGGGGGGYYGGGGGGGGASAGDSGVYVGSGGGGGGSSYVEPSAIRFRMWTGWKTKKADGLVVFSWK